MENFKSALRSARGDERSGSSNRGWLPLQSAHDFRSRQRLAEIISLEATAPLPGQKIKLLLSFYALGDYSHLQAVSHGDDGCNNGGIVRVGGDVAHKRLVDLSVLIG